MIKCMFASDHPKSRAYNCDQNAVWLLKDSTVGQSFKMCKACKIRNQEVSKNAYTANLLDEGAKTVLFERLT